MELQVQATYLAATIVGACGVEEGLNKGRKTGAASYITGAGITLFALGNLSKNIIAPSHPLMIGAIYIGIGNLCHFAGVEFAKRISKVEISSKDLPMIALQTAVGFCFAAPPLFFTKDLLSKV
jgi:hypothetical protein